MNTFESILTVHLCATQSFRIFVYVFLEFLTAPMFLFLFFPWCVVFLLFFNLLIYYQFIYLSFFVVFYFFYLMILSNFSYFLRFKMMDIYINTKCKQRLIYWFLTNKLFTLFSRHFLKCHRFFSLVVTCNGHFVKKYNDIALNRFVCDTL